MGLVRATTTGLGKCLSFSGRSSRSEFWGFVPVGLALPMVCALFLPPEVASLSTFIVKLLIVCFASLPLAAAGARRFQDTGLPAGDLWRGMRPTVIVIISGWFLRVGLTGIASIYLMAWGLIFFLGALLPFVVFLFIAPGTFGMSIGQLRPPSEPGPNRYGPNPSEVTS